MSDAGTQLVAPLGRAYGSSAGRASESAPAARRRPDVRRVVAAGSGVGGVSPRGLVRTPARRAQPLIEPAQDQHFGHPDQAQAGRRGPGAARGGADHGGPRRGGRGRAGRRSRPDTLRQGGHGSGGEGRARRVDRYDPRAGGAAIPARSGASAARDPGVRGQRHRQDHHDRQARPSVPLRRREGDAGRGRHIPRGGDRAARHLGRAGRLRRGQAAARRRRCRPRVRCAEAGPGRRRGRAADRHRGPLAQQGGADGRARQGRARAQKRSIRRPPTTSSWCSTRPRGRTRALRSRPSRAWCRSPVSW